MSEIALIVSIGIGAIAAFLFVRIARDARLLRPAETVYEWEHGLLYVDGRFARTLEPGRYRMLGLTDRLVVRLPRVPQYEQVRSVDVTGADRLSYRLSAVVTYTIEDPRTAHAGGYGEALRLATAEALRRLAAGRTVETALAEQTSLGEEAKTLLGPTVCGCAVSDVALTALSLPPELRRLYAEVERARLEGQAALERARGEQAALRSLANAARMLKGNPELMNLRLLQALSGSGTKGGATLVLGREALAAAAPDAAAGENG